MTDRFTPVDSWDEAMEILDRQKREADQHTLNWQWELITPGSFAIRIADGLLIFSEILEDYKEVGMQGFVYGKHYSIACVQGEIGDAHRATFLAVITQEMFEAARNLGWVVTTGFIG
ncbi:hypothetical protein E4H12_04470 [Candidatus Thorarchaeota archaeon]|nr:MAG: hypothetical protein E4H12_04470 [Candidatus Thorarchaeota archaeon]